jgi:hypothetical protein
VVALGEALLRRRNQWDALITDTLQDWVSGILELSRNQAKRLRAKATHAQRCHPQNVFNYFVSTLMAPISHMLVSLAAAIIC